MIEMQYRGGSRGVQRVPWNTFLKIEVKAN